MLDLWGYGPGHFDEHHARAEQLRTTLEDIVRIVIKRIKDALRHDDGYIQGIVAMDIYTAVLEINVRTVDQFMCWWGHHSNRSKCGGLAYALGGVVAGALRGDLATGAR